MSLFGSGAEKLEDARQAYASGKYAHAARYAQAAVAKLESGDLRLEAEVINALADERAESRFGNDALLDLAHEKFVKMYADKDGYAHYINNLAYKLVGEGQAAEAVKFINSRSSVQPSDLLHLTAAATTQKDKYFLLEQAVAHRQAMGAEEFYNHAAEVLLNSEWEVREDNDPFGSPLNIEHIRRASDILTRGAPRKYAELVRAAYFKQVNDSARQFAEELNNGIDNGYAEIVLLLAHGTLENLLGQYTGAEVPAEILRAALPIAVRFARARKKSYADDAIVGAILDKLGVLNLPKDAAENPKGLINFLAEHYAKKAKPEKEEGVPELVAVPPRKTAKLSRTTRSS